MCILLSQCFRQAQGNEENSRAALFLVNCIEEKAAWQAVRRIMLGREMLAVMSTCKIFEGNGHSKSGD